MFVDTEELLVTCLQPISPGQVSVEMPNSPPLPFILIARVAGGDDGITDLGIADVQVFHSSRSSASSVAWEAHYLLRGLNFAPITGVALPSGPTVFVDRITTIHGPAFVDYRDENLKRYCARYQVASRFTSQPF